MIKPYSLKAKLRKGWLGMLLFLIGGGLSSYVLYGPYYSPDTVNYFDFSRTLFGENTWAGIYSPIYPFLLRCLSASGSLSVFQAAHLIVLVQYGLGLCFLYLWTKTAAAHHKLGKERRQIFFCLVFVSFHSWWSFRILTWAHADASFYCLLIIWLYYLTQYHLKRRFQHLLIVSLLGAAMVWVKLNTLAFVPFYILLLLLGKNKAPWLVPIFTILGSYMGYRYMFRQNAFGEAINVGYETLLWSPESWGVFAANVSEFFKSSWGFIFSDVLTAFVPDSIAFAGGFLMLLSLVGLLVMETRKGISLSLLLLLFALVYLVCLMAFQQLIGFEEINYRTLFPYFLGFSWYVWLKVARLSTKRNILALILSLLMVLHTLAGHVGLWKRKDVNSLFEAERLAESALIQKARLLDQGSSQRMLFVSDRPEQLAILLNDPFVVHYDPEFDFIHGKRRPVPEQKRQQNRATLLEKLLKGEAVAVIFGEDEDLMRFAEESGLVVAKFPEGVVVYRE